MSSATCPESTDDGTARDRLRASRAGLVNTAQRHRDPGGRDRRPAAGHCGSLAPLLDNGGDAACPWCCLCSRLSSSAGWSQIHGRLIFRPLIGELLLEHGPADRRRHRAAPRHDRHRSRLDHERTACRPQLWTVLLMLPLAIPDFVVELRPWHSLWTWHARGSGRGDRDDARRLPVGLPPGRGQPAQLPTPDKRRSPAASASAGCATVLAGHACRRPVGAFPGWLPAGRAAVILAEYGAFEIFGYQTFTTESSLSSPLRIRARRRARSPSCWCCSACFVLSGEGRPAAAARGQVGAGRPARRARRHRSVARAGRCWPRCRRWSRLGAGRAGRQSACTGCSAPAPDDPRRRADSDSGAAHGRLRARRPRRLRDPWRVPVALLAVRHPPRRQLLERTSATWCLAMPGIVIARADLLRGDLCPRDRLRHLDAIDHLLLDHVLPARAGGGPGLAGQGAGQARRDGEVARRRPGGRPVADHAPLAGPGLMAAFAWSFCPLLPN